MLSNLHDIWVITNEYRGTGFILILYVVGLVYLFITEKDKKKRFLICYMPLSLLVLIYCPVFYHIYVVKLDDSGTYYRMFWLLPMTITIAYAACMAMYRHRRIGIIIACAAVILCGGYAYRQNDFTTVTRAENAYHIPDDVITLCDSMEPVIEGVNVYACVPTELLFYVRQYDSDINLIYGRDAVEPKWGYYNEYYEAFELSETLDLDALLSLTRASTDKTCTYFVIPEGRSMSGDPADYDLEEITRVNGYILYRDNTAVDIIREVFAGTAYDK